MPSAMVGDAAEQCAKCLVQTIFPVARVDREEAALLLRDVDLAVRDRGWELDVGPHLQLPEAVVRRAELRQPGARCVRWLS